MTGLRWSVLLSTFASWPLIATAWALPCSVTLKPDGNTAAVQQALDKPGPPPVVCLLPGSYKGARFQITRSATLRGTGRGAVVLDAGGQGRVLTVSQAGLQFVAENLTLTEGVAQEGGAVALLADAKLALRDVLLFRNRATLKGGGAVMANAGQLELTRVRLRDNTASSAAAIDLSGKVKARAAAILVTDNNVAANIDGPVRLTGAASLELRASTIAYNSGSAVVMAPGPTGSGSLQVDSCVLMGGPDAVNVQRQHASQAQVRRSVLYGGAAFVPIDRDSRKGLPGFGFNEPERYRPKLGALAIAMGDCSGPEVRVDVAGSARGKVCTAGALEASPADVAATLKQRQRQPKSPPEAVDW
jgi:hypothetical protein